MCIYDAGSQRGAVPVNNLQARKEASPLPYRSVYMLLFGWQRMWCHACEIGCLIVAILFKNGYLYTSQGLQNTPKTRQPISLL